MRLHVDILAALCILVAIIFGCITLYNGGNLHFYYKLLGIKNPSVVILIDFITHYLPVILLGLPSDPISYIKACGIIVIYYILMYNRLHSIYFGMI
jgi:hypothetical protein